MRPFLFLLFVVVSDAKKNSWRAVRGGEKNAVSNILDKLSPGVRAHVVGMAACTVLGMSGAVDADKVFALEPAWFSRLQWWRPATSSLYLGTPSMGWATSVFLLVKYGQELEAAVGTTAYVKFLILQVALLVTLGSLIGIPIVANALVTAIIYACSRLEPFGDIMFQFGIKLKYWMLPYALVVVEVLQKQSAIAAIPHLLGVLTAHFHHFFAVVWPHLRAMEEEGKRPLVPPSSKKTTTTTSKLAPALKQKKKKR
ncbi:hypothetical protein CTAYLR_009280 [Chrysophaeum taylorii]|uniref:Derlin n=1 Tax=Chrysophaeum taylorii TaxID=2483200 RepID=A0AAD7UIG1_9STRA|nr:hypothetical protein CTAYLR_009280 [Chrysophaeum taylorii]